MTSTLSASPRKVVPLAPGDYSRPRKDSASCPTITKRAFYCGVVVEGSENGRRLPDDVQDLVLSLGNALSSTGSNDLLSSPDLSEDINDPSTHRTRDTDPSTLQSVITELLTSERSYVKRLQILKNDYADPLRNFARSKDTAIIPAYEAKTLFGNIDNLLPVNEAFLADLEKMMTTNGVQLVGGVGDVALKHFKELRGFEQYKQYYVKREEAQLIFEREVSKRSARFVSFIDRIKYQSSDPRNRIGLRELLMEPVQRIPRYTLLFRNMIKNLAPDDPQRVKLLEADDIASKIALAEADEQTKRAAIFYCLTASIEGFPPDLFSNSRQYIDCIDVIDVPVDVASSSVSSTSGASPNGLPCSLFLFDDKLVIVKRPGNGEKGARTLSGLDELDKFTKASGLSISKKKSGMTCKGVVDVTEVVATDVGGCDLHLYLETPPQDQSDRWSGRPFRSLSVVLPPLAPNLDPIQAEATKSRFLENFWHTQAMYRARAGQSVVLRAEEQEVESKAGKVTFARAYYNVYQRTAFLQEPKKTKIVVHVDQLGTADPIPFGDGGPPFARIRLQPMAGGLCRYSVNSSIADEGEEDIVQTDRVPGRVIQTIHQFGLFEFKTGKTSAPSTPTARSRVAIFGLDAISRNLFNTRPGSSMGDFFGGSVNSHRRTKSTISRSSIYTQSTSTGDSLMKFSHRSNSTAATTISTIDDDSSFFASKSSRSRKLLKRGKSPGGSASDSEKTSPARRQTRSFEISRSPSPAVEQDTYYSDIEDDGTIMAKGRVVDSSEWDLAVQLELARRNSQNQPGLRIPPSIEAPTQDTIYEEDQPPPTARPLSRASRESNIPRPVSPNAARSTSPTSRHSKSSSLHAQDRRPLGPRCPSPLPSIRATPSPPPPEDTQADDNTSLVSPLTQVTPPGRGSQPSGIPRSKRQPFFPAGNTDTTPKASALPSTTSTIVEPLIIKKKSLVHPNGSTPASARKPYVRNSPLTRHPSRTVSRKVSPQLGKRKAVAAAGTSQLAVTAERISHLSTQTLEDIESSRRAIKRVKLLTDDSNSSQLTPGKDDEHIPRPSSPDKLSLRPAPALTKAAQDRMEEMRQMISRRQAEGTPRRIRNTLFDTALKSPAGSNSSEAPRLIESLAKDAEKDLTSAISKQEELQKEVQQLLTGLNAGFTELEKTRIELQNVKRQCELVKSLLADATAEKEIMYEAFNEELDCMYNDVNLPDDEAWVAMTQDLRKAKESRNALSKENSQLKRRIAELESQQEEWGNLLRAHGLIS